MNTQKKKLKLVKGRIPYIEAELNEFPSGWVIEYQYTDPKSFNLVRNRIKKQRERNQINDDQKARVIFDKECKSINKNLANGWTPKGELISKAKKDEEVIYFMRLFLEHKKRILRPDSIRTYKTVISRMEMWLKKKDTLHLSIYDFDIKHALKLSDYLLFQPKMSAATYNNNIANYKAIWNWIIDERHVIIENPFKRIKPQKEHSATKAITSKEWDLKIRSYCVENDPVLELVILLVYGPCFMRPMEIARTKIHFINLKKQTIILESESTKTHNTRVIYLTDEIVRLMVKLGIDKISNNQYLIGKQCGRYAPLTLGSKKQLNTRDIDKNWEKLRTSISLDKKYTLYSYKYKGVGELIMQGYAPDQIKLLTGHLSKAIENYIPLKAKSEAAKDMVCKVPTLGNGDL